METKLGIASAIIIGIIAYLFNEHLTFLEIGASTIALILGAILANFTVKFESGG